MNAGTVSPQHSSGEPTGRLVSDEAGQHYRIDGVEHMDPFLMTVVSDTDLWMFVSSTGALTAGRRNADHAAFPYQTDDRLHRAAGRVGPATVIAVVDAGGGHRELWRPFGPDVHAGGPRSLEKHVSGHRLVFEEQHPSRPLRWRAVWEPSDAFGWIRTCELANDGDGEVAVEILDGVVDVMPDGADAFFEQIRSNLVDAYKRSELVGSGPLAVYNLETLITDRAEPIEALSATVVWSTGLAGASTDLDERAVDDMLSGRPADVRSIVRGRAGAYVRRATLTLPARASESWMLAIDIGLGHADAARLADDVESGRAADEVRSDIAAGAARLDHLLANADAEQRTGEPIADAHHRSNVLFNSMRGGALVDGPNIPMADLAEFVRVRNPAVADRRATWLTPGDRSTRHVADVVADALDLGDADLTRLVLEYLPLTFSRRHGDPSRPWNRFDIDVRTSTGELRLAYEGNWRDIFQNWEALLRTTPAFLPSVVAKFVNATSLEGYNAYRITREGIEWEVPDPADPWSHLGYWGDHQLIYLLRLVDAWRATDPGALERWLDRPVFSSADIPYRLADHAEMVHDPRNTIEYDEEHAELIARREASSGTDGRLLPDDTGRVALAGLAEKLLVPALAKLACFVPGAGIWLNTQRPEWNDANNALAGSGASVVTLFHLRRYLATLADVVDGAASTLTVSDVVIEWFTATAAILDDAPVDPSDARAARALIDALGVAAAEHRARVRSGVSSSTTTVPSEQVVAMCRRSIEHVDATLAMSWRPDGLVHSYNLLSFPTAHTVEVGRLDLMLEGQVAALASGMLTADAVGDLVDNLFDSALHRPDLDTLLLYPATPIPPFLDRNTVTVRQQAMIDAAQIDPGALSAALVSDPDGRLRFRPDVVNAERLTEVLAGAGVAPEQVDVVLGVYEDVFDHESFTGRSARMYGYEGLGSVYWHMVAKLLLAVQECTWVALDDGADSQVVARLAAAYRRVRDGFGFRLSPGLFGAFPTDCYSHSPAHSGAQQPGMTGQVKEEVLTRFGELGLRVEAGRLQVAPTLLPVDEILAGGSASFSFCGVPMTFAVGEADRVEVRSTDSSNAFDSLALPADVSASLFDGRGEVRGVDWTLGPDAMARWRSAAGVTTE